MQKLPEIKNKKLLKQAFTHRSFLNESREKLESNERLEFLGDSVLSFVVSKYLYKTYPEFNEGILTNLRSLLVNTRSLANASKKLEFGTLLKLSKGEEESKGRENDSLLANSFEAFLGAAFLDGGIEMVEEFLSQTILYQAKGYAEKKAFKDPKSMLQEFVQANKQKSPAYHVLEEQGPAHARIFTVGVYVGEKLLGKGEGKSKQNAEEKAAKEALKILKVESD